jgi:alpha,alpha-trehalose phosphorylase
VIEHPAFPTDDWCIRETRVSPDVLGQSETLLALANGYLGLRGNLDEGTPSFEPGTYINGFYETRPIQYGERAYGYPDNGQTMLNVTDGKVITASVDGEPLDIATGRLGTHARVLDMRTATLRRTLQWVSPGGRELSVRSTRLVSFEHRHLAAIEYEIEVTDRPATLVVSSELHPNKSEQTNTGDPRETAALYGQVLLPLFSHGSEHRVVLGHTTRASKLNIVTGMDHRVTTECRYTTEQHHSDDRGAVTFTIAAEPGTPFTLVKYLAYHTSAVDSADKLHDRAHALLDRSVGDEFATLTERQTAFMTSFWQGADVVVEGDAAVQQAARFSQFQILQASARADTTGIPAKGLTGQGYEGHYFWDEEIFALDPLTYALPDVAKNVLLFRHQTIDAARARASEMNQRGALYPWRTINGEEASAYFPAGTAACHINADITYALRRYVDATGDVELLHDYGAEMLVETARFYADLGYFSDRRGGAFCIDEVTGPDEYSALVDNNTYTNLMAADNLRFAADTADQLRRDEPDVFERLTQRTDLDPAEIDLWRRAADHMYVPFDDELQIHGQDDSFLDQPRWDFANTPADHYPLLLHYHPLVLYRHQVIKQADLVLALQLQGDDIDLEQKRRDFDYYDALTTGDSSLSACMQAVVAAEVGYLEQAYSYARTTALMDIQNVNHNVRDGIHIAAMAGTWVALVRGFGGLRTGDGRLRFAPQLPSQWTRLRFSLEYRGRAVEVDIDQQTTTYGLRQGEPLTVVHWGDELEIPAGAPITAPTGSAA